MEEAKKYQDLISDNKINEILIEHNEINLMSLNQKENLDN
jgi:hypothetical protein